MRTMLNLVLAIVMCSLLSVPFYVGKPLAVHASSSRTTLSDQTTIVYVKDNRQLRLIQPDGSNDRLIWELPTGATGGIMSVAWRPDAQQIAFTSSHEATCSEWDADIYLIKPDGSNLRRLTNGPACDQLANYPQGSASVQVENRLANVNQVLVYIEGAPTAKVVNLPPNTTATIVFPQVADLGEGVLQNVVVINGNARWFDAAVNADIVVGESRHTGKITLATAGFEAYGAYHVSWNPQGSKLAYQFGQGRLWQVGLDVSTLDEGGPLLDPQINNTILGRSPVWSPVADEVLYEDFGSRPPTIVRAQVDGADAGTPLVTVVFTSGFSWLNDGLGLVAADDDDLLSHTDLYLMRFEDNSITQLTQTAAPEAAAFPKVSPDSSQIVYVYVPDVKAKPASYQLRIMNIDGSNDHLLVANGTRSDWSRVAPQNPVATATPVVPPTATPKPNATATPKPATTATPGTNFPKLFLPLVSR